MKQPLRSPRSWKHAGFIDVPFLIIAVASATHWTTGVVVKGHSLILAYNFRW
jgi:hypothetical protein